jgi:hypothetical protein
MRIDIERKPSGAGHDVHVHGQDGPVEVHYEGILRYRAEDRPTHFPEGCVRHTFHSAEDELDALIELNDPEIGDDEAA